MICWIHNRSSDVRQVLGYVFGPGDHSAHVDPRVVGAWPMAAVGGVQDLQRRGRLAGCRSVGWRTCLNSPSLLASTHRRGRSGTAR